MIKNSTLVYGMPQTGKSTLLVKQFIKDHGHDLVINLWTFLHRNPRAKTATLPFVRSANGSIKALQLPYDPNNWLPVLSAFHKQHPKIKRILMDECQCINSVYLVTLIMLIRDFYPKVPVLFTSIDFDSWHHRFPNINYLIQNTTKSKHLNHRCIFCHRIATRRLHIMDNKPMYNEKKYNYRLAHHKYNKKTGRPTLISVCSRHYENPPKNLRNGIIQNNKKYMSSNKKQRMARVRKALGLNSKTKIKMN